MKFEIPLVQGAVNVPCEHFWNAILVYLERPHLVNRRLAVAPQSGLFHVQYTSNIIARLNEAFTRSALINEIRRLPNIDRASITDAFIGSILEPYDKNYAIRMRDFDHFNTATCGTFVSIRILYPRQDRYEKCIELVVLDKDHNSATFFCTVERDRLAPAPDFPYQIDYDKGMIRLCVNEIEDADSASGEWLATVLFPKLLKWSQEFDLNVDIQKSLALISHEHYSTLYLQLKGKYGARLIQSWTENTDPHKFVYEDIAIATYLICLWTKYRPDQVPNFVDLGCGNGLLVYILNQEGFSGCGIDVRRRKIWDWYPSGTNLKVATIDPTAGLSFPECNWIIGNHSDELTPWIPVIAANSSYQTNFFLLPCCCYDFNGSKYKRGNSSMSSYADYINYIKTICVSPCEFIIEMDKLRIPSTKRICIVSLGRNYQEHEHSAKCDRIAQFIEKRCHQFRPRNQIEPVKNCTRLERKLIDRVVHATVDLLLREQNLIGTWNKGGQIALSNLAQQLDNDDLKRLKHECGGLQTLLKNHRYIFQLQNGHVELCAPLSVEESRGKYKGKPCWFFKNHPNGCYFAEDRCAYRHGL